MRTPWILAAFAVLAGLVRAQDIPFVGLRVDRGKYSLNVENTRLREIIAQFSHAVGVNVLLDPKLSGKKVTVRLSPRPPGRFFVALARRIGARPEIEHILARGQSKEPSAADSGFADRLIEMRTSGRIPLEEAVRELDANIKVAPGLDGSVSVFSPGLPLYRVLNSLSRQLDASWHTELKVEYLKPTDVEAESYERARDHFSDLARLSESERLEETRALLGDLALLPEKERSAAITVAAANISSLSSIYQQIPGEHRESLNSRFAGILHAYRTTLQERKSLQFDSLLNALQQAESEIRRSR
jgi:hypothetical protein